MFTGSSNLRPPIYNSDNIWDNNLNNDERIVIFIVLGLTVYSKQEQYNLRKDYVTNATEIKDRKEHYYY